MAVGKIRLLHLGCVDDYGIQELALDKLSSKSQARYLSRHLGQVLLGVERLPIVQLAEHEGQLGWNLQMVDAGNGAAPASLKNNED